ncbi:hypothetical protein BDV41DRAFT_528482 [Aspergillus transmontanensis]|uniref:Uncharacterized protein n=1 Tax=Aspergillus transmontanensis TaxID=1034304 RepID=A0A5N6WAU7_9EURO|nr:hypothetical protein BDV41DRAFT_528482 [Aspergillus transmontanensis]
MYVAILEPCGAAVVSSSGLVGIALLILVRISFVMGIIRNFLIQKPPAMEHARKSIGSSTQTVNLFVVVC